MKKLKDFYVTVTTHFFVTGETMQEAWETANDMIHNTPISGLNPTWNMDMELHEKEDKDD